MSDRKGFHIDKRAETIIDMLRRNYKNLDTKTSDSNTSLPGPATQHKATGGVVWRERRYGWRLLRRRSKGRSGSPCGPRCIRYKLGSVLAWLKARARESRKAA